MCRPRAATQALCKLHVPRTRSAVAPHCSTPSSSTHTGVLRRHASACRHHHARVHAQLAMRIYRAAPGKTTVHSAYASLPGCTPMERMAMPAGAPMLIPGAVHTAVITVDGIIRPKFVAAHQARRNGVPPPLALSCPRRPPRRRCPCLLQAGSATTRVIRAVLAVKVAALRAATEAGAPQAAALRASHRCWLWGSAPVALRRWSTRPPRLQAARMRVPRR